MGLRRLRGITRPNCSALACCPGAVERKRRVCQGVLSLQRPALSGSPHDAARRLYQDDSCGLARVVAAPGAPPPPAHDSGAAAWAAALAPGLPASQRSAALADLFGLPADGAMGK
jgi:hypothetical protein